MFVLRQQIRTRYVPLSSTFPEERLGTQCRTIGKAVELLLHEEEEVDRSRAEAVGGGLYIVVRPADSVRSASHNTSDAYRNGLFYTKGRLNDRLSIFALRIAQVETKAAALKVPEINFARLFVHELGEGLTPSLVLAYHAADAPPTAGFLSGTQYARHADTYERRLRDQMERILPEYQRPSTYVPLGSITRTISQKKDTKRIASLAAELHKCDLVEFAPFQLAF